MGLLLLKLFRGFCSEGSMSYRHPPMVQSEGGGSSAQRPTPGFPQLVSRGKGLFSDVNTSLQMPLTQEIKTL